MCLGAFRTRGTCGLSTEQASARVARALARVPTETWIAAEGAMTATIITSPKSRQLPSDTHDADHQCSWRWYFCWYGNSPGS
jgi:hypothetical protein